MNSLTLFYAMFHWSIVLLYISHSEYFHPNQNFFQDCKAYNTYSIKTCAVDFSTDTSCKGKIGQHSTMVSSKSHKPLLLLLLLLFRCNIIRRLPFVIRLSHYDHYWPIINWPCNSHMTCTVAGRALQRHLSRGGLVWCSDLVRPTTINRVMDFRQLLVATMMIM